MLPPVSFCILIAFPKKLRGDDGQIVALMAASAVVLDVVQNRAAQLGCRQVRAFANEPRKPGFPKILLRGDCTLPECRRCKSGEDRRAIRRSSPAEPGLPEQYPRAG